MAKYYVNFEPNEERVIRYEDLRVTTYQGIASQTKHQLDAIFTLTKPLEIREAGNVLAESEELALLNAVCELTFEVDGQQKHVEMRPTNDSRLYVGGNSLFSCPINAKDVMRQTLTLCSQDNISFPLSQLQYGAKDANMDASKWHSNQSASIRTKGMLKCGLVGGCNGHNKYPPLPLNIHQ
jgi:hypothetical protein